MSPSEAARWLTCPGSLTLEAPLPRTPEGGYESVSWIDAPLAQRYGLPGETKTPRKRRGVQTRPQRRA